LLGVSAVVIGLVGNVAMDFQDHLIYGLADLGGVRLII